MSIVQNAGAGEGVGFYNNVVNQSLRFNDDDSAYLNRAITTNGSAKKSTFSCWIKQSKLNSSTISHVLYNQGDDTGSNHYNIVLYQDDIYINDYDYGSSGSPGSDILLQTDRKFRDTSAWMNIIVRVDTTQSTAADRVRLYINGVQETSFSTATYPNEDADLHVMNQTAQSTGVDTSAVLIGRYTNSHKNDCYMADINYCDGQSLAPSNFGETKDGIWIPKNTSGLTFGTNGFRLEFKQTGTGTASTSTIGADTSGQTNHFTSNNLAATDSNMPDCPENNFATLNPLAKGSGTVVFSEGNLKSSHAVSLAVSEHAATFTLPKSGKWYWEAAYTGVAADGSQGILMGILDMDTSTIGLSGNHITTGTGNFIGWYSHNNNISINNTRTDFTTDNVVNQTTGIVSFAIDLDNNHMWVAVNNTYINGTPDFSDGSNKIASPNSTATWLPYFAGNGGATFTWTVNFGQDSANVSSANADSNGIGTFEYAVPSGYLALCSTNLPEITIGPEQDTQADDHFNTVIYNGNSSTNNITGVGFSPDWVWLKQRNAAENHFLTDSVRGAGLHLRSDATTAESDTSASFTTFGADGFSLTGSGNAADQINDDGDTYVAWNWLAGTAFSNSAGANGATIASSGQVNTTAGFSIVKFTGNATSGATIKHGLAVAPGAIILKSRDAARDWRVYHSAIGATKTLDLNKSGTVQGANAAYWNNTAPTTAVFSVGNVTTVNGDGEDYIAYCFAEVDGYSKFGSHEGNNNANGTFVHTGFRPAWLMIKNLDAAGSWIIFDNTREGGVSNIVNDHLMADTTADEGTDNDIDFVSSGFKCRRASQSFNTAHTFVYLAFADQPFKFANAR